MVAASHEIPELDRKGLRSFGLTTGGLLALLFGLLLPWALDHSLPVWPWALCAVLVLWALLFPARLRPVYRVWMRFGLLMSRITTPLILGLAFFVIVTPIALIRHLLGKDSMARRFDRAAESYRVWSRKPTKENLEKPY